MIDIKKISTDLKNVFFSLLVLCLILLTTGNSAVAATSKDSIKAYINGQISHIIEIINQQPDDAMDLATTNLQLAEQNSFLEEKSEIIRLIGLVWYYKGEYAKALDFFNQSHQIASTINYPKGVSSSLNNISLVYRDQGYYDKALTMDLQVLKIREELKDSDLIAGSYNNVAAAYMDIDSNDIALNYLKKAVNISELMNDSSSMDLYLNNIGVLYWIEDQHDSMMHYFNKSLTYSVPLNHKQMMSNTYSYIGEHYLEEKRLKDAIVYLEKGLKLAQEIEIVYEVEYICEILHNAYAQTGNFEKAYNIHMLYKEMADSSKNVEVIQRITKTEAETQFEKERELDRVKQENITLENQLKLNKEKQIKDIAITIGIALLVILIYAYRTVLLKTRDNNLLQEQKIEIVKQRDQIEALNKTKDRFLAIIAHDLRNPLGGIHKLSEVLDTNFDFLGSESLKKYISNIRTTSDKVYKLLDNLLQWASFQMGSVVINKQKFNLMEVINENIELLKGSLTQKSIELSYDDKLACPVQADRKMISTVIRNLMTNAVKFTPEYGKINIQTYKENEECYFTITDNGPGIQKEELSAIFELGNTSNKSKTKEQGIGLGLVLCKEFTQLNGGRIWVDSKPNEGATFTFVIPYKA